MSFNLYDVDGASAPLRLSPEHAERIGATLHVPDEDGDADGPKSGSKAALVAEAERLGLSTEGTKADIEARIAEAS